MAEKGQKPGKSRDEEHKTRENISRSAHLALRANGPLQKPAESPQSVLMTHLLVVSGGGRPASLGEFFGLIEYFEGLKASMSEDPRFAGDYWTTFHPDEYFDQPKTVAKGIDTIKFDGRVVFTRTQASQGGQRLAHIPPEQMRGRIHRWIDHKVDQTVENGAKPGDFVVNVFLCREENEGLVIGSPHKDRILATADFVNALQKIHRNVHFSCLSKGYRSGIFATKIQQDGPRDRWVVEAATTRQSAYQSNKSASKCQS